MWPFASPHDQNTSWTNHVKSLMMNRALSGPVEKSRQRSPTRQAYSAVVATKAGSRYGDGARSHCSEDSQRKRPSGRTKHVRLVWLAALTAETARLGAPGLGG